MMKCSFCGFEFDEKSLDSASCRGCPMSGRCGKIKCPRCGFEMVKPSGFFRKLFGKEKVV
ncbi:MAG: hypothetical protein NUV45_09550 [Tepidanaerobacteraceae bacterium]|jgi:rubredoxin|nr:hypothetical protein [Tepidanaerobacteraceae bacterium]